MFVGLNCEVVRWQRTTGTLGADETEVLPPLAMHGVLHCPGFDEPEGALRLACCSKCVIKNKGASRLG